MSAVARMSDKEAHARFVAIRWADNDGKPYCPDCGCAKVYAYTTRKLWKCTACRYQFSVTARMIFADRKRPIRDYLLAIAIFVNGAKGAQRAPTEPRPGLPVQDGFRFGAQAARGYRGRSAGRPRADRLMIAQSRVDCQILV